MSHAVSACLVICHSFKNNLFPTVNPDAALQHMGYKYVDLLAFWLRLTVAF